MRHAVQVVERRRPQDAVVLDIPFPVRRAAGSLSAMQAPVGAAGVVDPGPQQHSQCADGRDRNAEQYEIHRIGRRQGSERSHRAEEQEPRRQHAENHAGHACQRAAEKTDDHDRGEIGRERNHGLRPGELESVSDGHGDPDHANGDGLSANQVCGVQTGRKLQDDDPFIRSCNPTTAL